MRLSESARWIAAAALGYLAWKGVTIGGAYPTGHAPPYGLYLAAAGALIGWRWAQQTGALGERLERYRTLTMGLLVLLVLTVLATVLHGELNGWDFWTGY